MLFTLYRYYYIIIYINYKEQQLFDVSNFEDSSVDHKINDPVARIRHELGEIVADSQINMEICDAIAGVLDSPVARIERLEAVSKTKGITEVVDGMKTARNWMEEYSEQHKAVVNKLGEQAAEINRQEDVARGSENWQQNPDAHPKHED